MGTGRDDQAKTIQIYMFSGYDILCEFLNIKDQFLKLTILRVITK